MRLPSPLETEQGCCLQSARDGAGLLRARSGPFLAPRPHTEEAAPAPAARIRAGRRAWARVPTGVGARGAQVRFDEFLRAHLGVWAGPLVEAESGRVLGLHDGFWFFTPGQRRGIGLAGGPWRAAPSPPRGLQLSGRRRAGGEFDRVRLASGPWRARPRPMRSSCSATDYPTPYPLPVPPQVRGAQGRGGQRGVRLARILQRG